MLARAVNLGGARRIGYNRGVRLSEYREVGSTGEPYPAWLRALVGEHGVYVIRDRFNHEPLYVGESHSGRLYETLTRHLQAWNPSAGYAGGNSYYRENVEVAVVRISNPADVKPLQRHLIDELEPIDNTYVYADEEVPF